MPDIAQVACLPASLNSQKQRRIAKETIEMVEEVVRYFESSDDDAIISEAEDLISRCIKSKQSIENAIFLVSESLKNRPKDRDLPTSAGETDPSGNTGNRRRAA